jgi:hypothetical protein
MAENTPSTETRGGRSRGSSEFRNYEEWFTASPDPWAEIAKLEHGSDRTFATTVRSMVMNAEPAQRPAMETRLLQVLANPKSTEVARMFIVRMLALIGSEKCVPALAPLLADPRTTDVARYALDEITDPAIDEIYRNALGQLSGPAKVGLIGSIGLRGDIKAIGALIALEKNAGETAEVRTAATRALERLTTKA